LDYSFAREGRSRNGLWVRAAAASHPHDDLADLLIRLQVAMSLNDLLEPEGLGDDRLQAAICQAVGDKTFATLQSGRVAGRVERDLRQPKAAQDDGLSAAFSQLR
jgi:hypothetical protein